MPENQIKRGSVVTVQIGNFGEKGYRKSMPAKVLDITKNGDLKEYWFKILGLNVAGKAHKPQGVKTDLFCSIKNLAGAEGNHPRVKGVNSLSDAAAYLGYYSQVPA